MRRSLLRSFLSLAALPTVALTLPATPAEASGAVERLIQVVAHPTDPNVMAVRWGVANGSAGFLISRDGGKSFQAMCSQAIAPDLPKSDRILSIPGEIAGNAATLFDAQGHLLVGQLSSLWVDDGTACTWSEDAAMRGKWAYSIRRDPKNPAELVATVIDTGATGGASSVLMRRSADGKWTAAGSFGARAAGQDAIASDLAVTSTKTGARYYVLYRVSAGAADNTSVLSSDDLGKTWRAGTKLPAAQADISLLAVDPTNPDRLLGLIRHDDALDTLLLSEDAGKTFKKYQELREVSGVAFGPDGRVYVGDAGDSSGEDDTDGGLYTAEKLGGALTKVGDTRSIDCIHYNAQAKKLNVCRRDSFGLMDPTSGAYEELTQLEKVEKLLACPNKDMVAACESQLNAGPTWCCAGHYPFTPFCGEYDVREQDGRTVYCGLAGREYDEMAGRGPSDGLMRDAGASSGRDGGVRRDAGASSDDGSDSEPGGSTTPPASGDGGGCSAADGTRASAGWLSLVGGLALAVLLGRRRQRGTRA